MQTFITDTPDNSWGVSNLDQKRLVKQLLECRQIMAALAGETKGWVNHPATKMWHGKEGMLYDYALSVAWEMKSRNYKWENNLEQLRNSYFNITDHCDSTPHHHFNTDALDRIIYTHRGRLYEKDPEYYSQWSDYANYKKYVCCERCNTYWPTHLEK